MSSRRYRVSPELQEHLVGLGWAPPRRHMIKKIAGLLLDDPSIMALSDRLLRRSVRIRFPKATHMVARRAVIRARVAYAARKVSHG